MRFNKKRTFNFLEKQNNYFMRNKGAHTAMMGFSLAVYGFMNAQPEYIFVGANIATESMAWQSAINKGDLEGRLQ
jgi:hypothetical protein